MSGAGRILGFGERARQAALAPRSVKEGTALERLGLVALILSAVVLFAVFARDFPWQRGFELNAVFSNAATVRIGSPVRIAGVDVGVVEGVTRAGETNFSRVRMKLDDTALPIKRDARAKIRQRIFLEGNPFIDLKPGTPSAPDVESGYFIPVTQTATGVQIDEVLTALQSNTRSDLRETLKGLSEGLDGTEQQSESSGGDAQVEAGDQEDVEGEGEAGGQKVADGEGEAGDQGDERELSGAEAINRTFDNQASALKSTARVNEALLGERTGDLAKTIQGLQRTVSALEQNEPALKDLVTNFNVTAGALASESSSLRATVRELPGTVRVARSTLTHLEGSLPAANALFRELRPGVREIPAVVDASPEWLTQVGELVQDDELGGVAADLRPTVRNLAEAAGDGLKLLDEIDLASRCMTDVLVPTFSSPVNDPPHTTGKETYKEFFYSLVGVTSATQNQDGNGPFLAFGTRGGDTTVSLGRVDGVGDPVFANAASDNLPLGTRPKIPNKRPPYGPEKACKDQRRPDLNSAETGPAPKVVATGSSAGAAGLDADQDDSSSENGGVFGDLDSDPLEGGGGR